MLFSSYKFLFMYLTATAVVFHLVEPHFGMRLAVAWAVAASEPKTIDEHLAHQRGERAR
jgi:hypothetical protein